MWVFPKPPKKDSKPYLHIKAEPALGIELLIKLIQNAIWDCDHQIFYKSSYWIQCQFSRMSQS